MANIQFLLNVPGTRCPIGGGIMNNPAILAGTGVSFERATIEAHLRAHGTDPVSGQRLSVREQRLLPNPALKGLIDAIMAAIVVRVQPEA